MKQKVSEIMSDKNKNRTSSIQEIENCRSRKDRVVLAYVKDSPLTIELGKIELRDRMLRQIVKILCSKQTAVGRLILRDNNLTDKGARALCVLLRQGPVPVLCDMRGNLSSAEAVRHMAKALERNKSVQAVSVTTDGLIKASTNENDLVVDCRGISSDCSLHTESAQNTSCSALVKTLDGTKKNYPSTNSRQAALKYRTSKSRLRQAGLASVLN